MGFGIASVHHSTRLCDVLESLLSRESEIYKVADCPLGPLYREDVIAAANSLVLTMSLMVQIPRWIMPQPLIPRLSNGVPITSGPHRRKPQHTQTILSGYQKTWRGNLRRISSRSLRKCRPVDLEFIARCKYYIHWFGCAMFGRGCAIIER